MIIDNVTDFSPDALPVGELRADGVDINLGTPGNEFIGTQSSLGANLIPIEETPDSPTIERAEQTTVTHKFTMSWADAVTQIKNLYRGQLYWNDSSQTEDTAIFKILSVRITHVIGNTATLEIVSEALNIDNPPDLFNVSAVELGVNILKHPRYFWILRGGRGDSAQEQENGLLNQQVIRLLQNYFDNSNINVRNAYIEWLYYSLGYPGSVVDGLVVNDSPITITQPPGTASRTFTPLTGTDCAKYAAMEIIQKYWLGIETPYIAGWQITYSKYHWTPPQLHPGGVIDNPFETVDEQFLYDDNGDSIFKQMAALNPQCYSDNGKAEGNTSISWLRKADTVTFERTFYRQDMTWIGSPVGYWDTDLFGTSTPDSGIDRCGYGNITPVRLPPMPAVPTEPK